MDWSVGQAAINLRLAVSDWCLAAGARCKEASRLTTVKRHIHTASGALSKPKHAEVVGRSCCQFTPPRQNKRRKEPSSHCKVLMSREAQAWNDTEPDQSSLR